MKFSVLPLSVIPESFIFFELSKVAALQFLRYPIRSGETLVATVIPSPLETVS